MNLENIEKEFDVGQLKHGDVSIWPVIKSYVIGLSKDTQIIKEATPLTLKLLLKNLFPDIFSVRNFKRSGTWVFTNSERRYNINQDSFDRVATGLLNYLDHYLLFENPLPKGRTKGNRLQEGEYYIGLSWIYLLQFLIVRTSKSPVIENWQELEDHLDLDLGKIRKIYHRICAGAKVYDWLIRIYRPKAIFVVCYYSNFEIIKAAKKNNIPVVELQHGLVSKGHRAYFFSSYPGASYLPDYFLSYGRYSSELVTAGKVVHPDQVLNYGYSFLEEVSKKLRVSDELAALKRTFRSVICITGQLPKTDVPLLRMIGDISQAFPDTCFIFKPRYAGAGLLLPERPNFFQMAHLNTYELLKYSDYHITVYSTCAMESLALGTPNISIDIEGYYSRFLKKILDGNRYNYVVQTNEGLTETLSRLEGIKVDREEVMKSIDAVFSKMVSLETFHEFFQKIIKQEPRH